MAYRDLISKIMKEKKVEEVEKEEEYRKRMEYVNKVSQKLAERLYEKVGETVEKNVENAKKAGRPTPPGTILSFGESMYIGLPQKSGGEYDEKIPVYADGMGNVYPQERMPEGGYPKREGDERRIPISQCIFGFSSGKTLEERGITTMMEVLSKKLNSDGPMALYLLSGGHAKLTLHMVWDIERFEYNQAKRMEKFGKEFRPTMVTEREYIVEQSMRKVYVGKEYTTGKEEVRKGLGNLGSLVEVDGGLNLIKDGVRVRKMSTGERIYTGATNN